MSPTIIVPTFPLRPARRARAAAFEPRGPGRDARALLAWIAVAFAALASVTSAQDSADSAASPAVAARALDPTEAARLARREPRADTETVPGAIAERFRVVRGSPDPSAPGGESLRIRSLEGFIDYDEEEQVFYGPSRTQIWYGEFYLEADKVVLDNRLEEVQAEGNVILRIDSPEYPGVEFRCDSLRFSFTEYEGVAWNVSGEYPPVFLRGLKPGDPDLPPLRQISREESLFRDSEVTTCDFKKPHYAVRAREVILFMNDRIFFRGATMRVWDVPVLYLPYYSRSITERSPWFVMLGYGDRTGARVRFGYAYRHRTEEPSLEDDDEYEVRSQGEARTFVDYLSERGAGMGFDYRYRLDYGRHEGDASVYGIGDEEREVAIDTTIGDDEQGSEAERFAVRWRHRAEFSPRNYAVADIDWFSDPEIFYDILDRFADQGMERERQIERRARGAVTWLREAYVARLLVDVKDRVGIDRYGNLSNPADNDQDFEIDPFVRLDDSTANSIGKDRWGRVSEKLPQVTLANRYIPFRKWPIYLLSRADVYNNLDKGINVVSSEDDARVAGLDTYHQLLWRYRITERYVLLAKLGVGMGAAERSDDELGIDLADLESEDTLPLLDDDGDFLVGRRRRNLDQIRPFYAWGDAEVRLNARFSDSLTGFLLWRYRETTDDFVGDFYADLGDTTFRDDLFPYRLREHLVHANLNYFLLYPNVYLFTNVARSLVEEGERYPNENMGYWNVGGGWSNRASTLRLTSAVGGDRRQTLHPSDPASSVDSGIFYTAEARYQPRHSRWYTKVRYEHFGASGDFESSSSEDFTLFSDEQGRDRVETIYGRELGLKWNGEIQFQWDSQVEGLRQMALLVQRDLHDAFIYAQLRSRRDPTRAESRSDNSQEMDVSFGLNFKLPDQGMPIGSGRVRTVSGGERAPQLAY